MKNADKSIHPSSYYNQETGATSEHKGLTKREYVATKVVQSLLNRGGVGNVDINEMNIIINDAIAITDKLLEQLEL